MPEKPLVFVSHRHADREIAEKVGNFLREHTGNGVRIHLSSSPGFEGPRVGKELNNELKQALAQADVVLLVYTVDTDDWSYCMWECGVATDPNDQRKTEIIVLQCGEGAPKPYGDRLRVDVRDVDSIQDFLIPLLTSVELFHTRDVPLTGFTGESPELRAFAQKLRDTLTPLVRSKPETRDAAPFLRFELDGTSRGAVRQAFDERDQPRLQALVTANARVVEHRTEGLFGFDLDDATLGSIASRWAEEHPGRGRWIESMVEQIGTITSGRHPVVPWAPYRVESGRATIPVVARSRSFQKTGPLQFDTYFVPMSPRPVRVTERMIALESMFHKNLGVAPAADINLCQLRAEMKKEGRTRVPILGEDGHPLYIVHGSVIAEYLTDMATSGVDVPSLSLRDLLDHAAYSELLASSIAVVGPEANLEEATRALESIPQCQDVFVTVDGTRGGKVLGWLTNTMLVDPA